MPLPEGLAFTPMIVAREQGFFAEQGIDVTSSVADGSVGSAAGVAGRPGCRSRSGNRSRICSATS